MASPVIITCAVTGGGLGMSIDERLAAALEASPEMPWAAMKASANGCDMPGYSLDADTATRQVMVAHA